MPHLQTRDGTELFYRDWGTGRPVVFVHGMLSSVTVPALILHGDHDPFAPLEACGRRSAELISGSRLLVYPGAAHLPHLSHRQRLNTDLLAFVREHGMLE